ncbi:hypothetical protein Bbelb_369620, partial [Branchiostoma belcheri]
REGSGLLWRPAVFEGLYGSTFRRCLRAKSGGSHLCHGVIGVISNVKGNQTRAADCQTSSGYRNCVWTDAGSTGSVETGDKGAETRVVRMQMSTDTRRETCQNVGRVTSQDALPADT